MADGWLPSAHDGNQSGLGHRVARGLSWTVIDVWGRQGLSLVVFIVLAKLLQPADFGLVALAAVFVNLAQVVVDQGMGDALIQRRQLSRSQVDTAFWVAMATGLLLTAAGVLLAGPIAALLQQPELAPILQVLSITFVLAAMSSIQVALLRRELAFRSLALRALFAAVVGGAIGIAMAYTGFGAWSLVGQQVATAIASVLALWRLLPWRPSRHFSRAEFRDLFSFGSRVVGSDILTFLSRNTDNLLIGTFLGTTQLGLYAVGYRILDTTQSLVIQIARKITFPAFASLQHDKRRMRAAYFRVSRAGAALIMPAYVGLALTAPELIVTVFGERWAESGPVAAVLFLIGPALSLQAFSGSFLYAANQPGIVFRIRLITTITNVIGFAIAVPFGILAVAAAFSLRGYLITPLILFWMRTHAGIPIVEYLAQFRGVALATAAMAAVVGVVKLTVGMDAGPAQLLGLEALAGALAFTGTIWLVDRPLVGDVLRVSRQAMVRGGDRRPDPVAGPDAIEDDPA